MTTLQPALSLSFQEVVRLEQALAEGIIQYRKIIDETKDKARYNKVLEACLQEWENLLEKSTKLYPENPRNWGV